MIKNDPQHKVDKKAADHKKKTYQKPRILSVEKMEVVASTCNGGKSAPDPACGAGPINS